MSAFAASRSSTPDPKTLFDKYAVHADEWTDAGEVYKAFAVENASGQRLYVVVSGDDVSEDDDDLWLQRVAFVSDLSILGD
ncbi:hypothetical protein AAVH_23175 [Aphelenchoides avenae]|nr:hypothetical protein AAVH_23175 [Aphelenchus avenae]